MWRNNVMTTKEKYDQYATELNRRFEEMMTWAIQYWPKKHFPLLPSDFNASRREIGQIIGPKLGDSNSENMTMNDGENQTPFIDTKPMPWP